MSDAASAGAVSLFVIGDRLGFFADLALNGPTTIEELARRLNVSERYAKEWLGAMKSAGYVDFIPRSKKFRLPNGAKPVVADESSPLFLAGALGLLWETFSSVPSVIDAFRSGNGIPADTYSKRMSEENARFSSPWFNNDLVNEWIPAIPVIEKGLREGIKVADVGCGRGRALIRLAKSFPHSHFFGFDAFPPSIEGAKQNARAAGLSDKIEFQVLDMEAGLPGKYDLITTFHVLHHASDPDATLSLIRNALEPSGKYLCLEFPSTTNLAKAVGATSTFLGASSVLYCTPTTLAKGGFALGTIGLPEQVLKSYAKKAGFTKVRRVPIRSLLNALYLLSG